MVLEDFVFDAPQRRPHRLYLRQDIDAVPVVLDHARNAAHLAFDTAQASATGFGGWLLHA
jgi:hypothetical protein